MAGTMMNVDITSGTANSSMKEPGPLFSIITVCFNAAKTIARAAESLMQQTHTDYEWIVIDGGSNDGTLAVLDSQLNKAAVVVSEPDGGIFDAMNKGVRAAVGQWLYFLNADDRFSDDRVLEDVASALFSTPVNSSLVYGDVTYTDGESSWPRHFHWVNRRTLPYGDLCHQAVFASRDLFTRMSGFDTALRTNADYDWLLRVFSAGVRVQHLDREIAVFSCGGAHMQDPARHRRERIAIRRRYFSPVALVFGTAMVRAELKLRKLLGQTV